jgi:hypothetical protein
LRSRQGPRPGIGEYRRASSWAVTQIAVARPTDRRRYPLDARTRTTAITWVADSVIRWCLSVVRDAGKRSRMSGAAGRRNCRLGGTPASEHGWA